MNTNQARMQRVSLVEARIEELKERLRVNHDLGCQLVAEIVRLERECQRYVVAGESLRPSLVVVNRDERRTA